MSSVIKAQVWHRRLGHLNKRNLDIMNSKNGNGAAFVGSIAAVTSARWGQAISWLTPRKPTTPP